MWIEDETQPIGAVATNNQNYFAVDQKGNPAFIDKKGQIHHKRGGSWITIPGCAAGIAFVGKSSLFKRACTGSYIEQALGNRWIRPYNNQKAYGLVGDAAGTLWVHDGRNVLFWD